MENKYKELIEKTLDINEEYISDFLLDFRNDIKKEDLITYIRRTLSILGTNHKTKVSFDFSGYDSGYRGQNVEINSLILNIFSRFGIYDFTHYLYLDFYKGAPTLYLMYWGEEENKEFDFSGLSTSEIIYEIFKLTVFSGKKERRR